MSLGWTGARFEEHWSIRDIPGAVVDFQIVRLQGTAAQIIAIVKSSKGVLYPTTIQVMSYTAK